jgi:hypothetical protein
MAFPGTYNISYYKGDTLEFRIYPKNSSGAVFPLDGYDLVNGVKFTIAPTRGSSGVADQVEAFAEISIDRTYISCAILPSSGNLLNASSQYVYDIEISKVGQSGYDYTYTLLTGTISVTDQVTGAV